MPICPHCGEDITELHFMSYETDSGIAELNGGSLDYHSKYQDIDRIEFTCPACDSLITTKENEAEEFLNKK